MHRFFREHFFLLFSLVMAWNALFILASVLYRRRKGKRFFRPRFDDARFLETWRSGRSLRGFFSRLGGASNCLYVALADDTLHIGPHFPFTLGFMPEIYGLEYEIPVAAIRSAQPSDGPFTRGRIRLTFTHPAGHDESLEVHLKDPGALLRAVAVCRGDAPA